MEQLRDRFRAFLAVTTPAQRVGIAVSVVVGVLAAAAFLRWISTPSYALLYAGLDDKALSRVVQELDSQGVPYRIEGAGSRVMVPQDHVYRVRASLAEAGVAGQTMPAGYELFDEQGLGTTDFQQRVDYQRALEGELAKTLMAMESIEGATVRIAIPERSPFDQQASSATASVLVSPSAPLSEQQVRAIVFLVANAVPGLTPEQVTVADTGGQVLAAPGTDPLGIAGDQTFELTHRFEQALAADVQRLLANVPGGANASVVVRARLNFDQTSIETETVDPDSAVPVDSSQTEETLTQPPGVDGGATGGTAGVDYRRTDSQQSYAVSREATKTIQAPGDVEQLSVAVVMDNGQNTGIAPADPNQIEALVSAALGLDPTRGDTIEITQLPFPKAEPEAEPNGPGIMDLAPRAAGGLVVLLAGAAMFLMVLRSRGGRRRRGAAPELAWNEPEQLPAGEAERVADARPVSVAVPTVDVMELVQRQPEEIASLLRAWLADRRR
jgi:flagellar M-ring protein FliF